MSEKVIPFFSTNLVQIASGPKVSLYKLLLELTGTDYQRNEYPPLCLLHSLNPPCEISQLDHFDDVAVILHPETQPEANLLKDIAEKAHAVDARLIGILHQSSRWGKDSTAVAEIEAIFESQVVLYSHDKRLYKVWDFFCQLCLATRDQDHLAFKTALDELTRLITEDKSIAAKKHIHVLTQLCQYYCILFDSLPEIEVGDQELFQLENLIVSPDDVEARKRDVSQAAFWLKKFATDGEAISPSVLAEALTTEWDEQKFGPVPKTVQTLLNCLNGNEVGPPEMVQSAYIALRARLRQAELYTQPDWHNRRYMLDHDWLKNSFCEMLRGLIQNIHSPQPDVADVIAFIEIDLPKWERKYAPHIQNLLETYEQEMSPRVWCHQIPFLTDKADIMHDQWLSEYNVTAKLRRVKGALDQAHQTYQTIVKALPHDNSITLDQAQRLSPDLETFAKQCKSLQNALQLDVFPPYIPLLL